MGPQDDYKDYPSHNFIPYIPIESSIAKTVQSGDVLKSHSRLLYIDRSIEIDETPNIAKYKTSSRKNVPTSEITFGLGTSALQKVVDQMKAMNAPTKVKLYDKDATKRAGIPNYCDYLANRNFQTTGITQENIMVSSE